MKFMRDRQELEHTLILMHENQGVVKLLTVA
jgi:hypothetical protein